MRSRISAGIITLPATASILGNRPRNGHAGARGSRSRFRPSTDMSGGSGSLKACPAEFPGDTSCRAMDKANKPERSQSTIGLPSLPRMPRMIVMAATAHVRPMVDNSVNERHGRNIPGITRPVKSSGQRPDVPDEGYDTKVRLQAARHGCIRGEISSSIALPVCCLLQFLALLGFGPAPFIYVLRCCSRCTPFLPRR